MEPAFVTALRRIGCVAYSGQEVGFGSGRAVLNLDGSLIPIELGADGWPVSWPTGLIPRDKLDREVGELRHEVACLHEELADLQISGPTCSTCSDLCANLAAAQAEAASARSQMAALVEKVGDLNDQIAALLEENRALANTAPDQQSKERILRVLDHTATKIAQIRTSVSSTI